jgi:hypothetical protein
MGETTNSFIKLSKKDKKIQEPRQELNPKPDYKLKEAKEKQNMISQFIEKHQLVGKVIEMKGKKFLLLEPQDTPNINEIKVAQYLAQHIIAEKNGIFNNCFSIANDACKAGHATGRVCARTGTSDFVGWDNHCINFDELNDSVVSLDLTASRNIDRNQGFVNVLAIRAKTLEELLAQLGELYGGQWQVIQVD